MSILATPKGSSYVWAMPSIPYLNDDEGMGLMREVGDTYSVKDTNATSGTAHQSISEAMANGSIPQNSARVCL